MPAQRGGRAWHDTLAFTHVDHIFNHCPHTFSNMCWQFHHITYYQPHAHTITHIIFAQALLQVSLRAYINSSTSHRVSSCSRKFNHINPNIDYIESNTAEVCNSVWCAPNQQACSSAHKPIPPTLHSRTQYHHTYMLTATTISPSQF